MILIFLGAGAVDPTSNLIALAVQRLGSKNRFHQMAIGFNNSVQQLAVLESIRYCAKVGDWLCLNNVHFIGNFIPYILQVKLKSIFIKLMN